MGLVDYNHMSVPSYPLKDCAFDDPRKILIENFTDKELCIINEDPLYYLQYDYLADIKKEMTI